MVKGNLETTGIGDRAPAERACHYPQIPRKKFNKNDK
jgi:hypothetical protein